MVGCSFQLGAQGRPTLRRWHLSNDTREGRDEATRIPGKETLRQSNRDPQVQNPGSSLDFQEVCLIVSWILSIFYLNFFIWTMVCIRAPLGVPGASSPFGKKHDA